MMPRIRFLISAAIVIVAFLNLWQVTHSLRSAKSRDADDVVILEDHYRFVRDALMKERYWRGDVGYMPAGVLSGHARTLMDDQQWALVRYVMIPWNVLQDNLGPQYVILDGTRTKERIQTPQGFTKIYDSMNGLAVLKKVSAQ